MFTMSKIKASKNNGANFFHDHLSSNDYYSEHEKVTGHWFGTLAETFGVKGKEVSPQEFAALQNNINPYWNGKLTPGVKNDSTRFFDFQCSAQKSVSIMAVVMNDKRLVDAHHDAVKAALAELEKFAACRIRKGEFRNSEKLEITGNILAALYNHDASRALDPQLHTHCVVANCTLSDSESRLKALSESEMVKAIRYAGKFYQSTMARKVQELGYEISVTKTEKGIEGFEIAGVDQSLLERYSRRRAEIEKEIEKFKAETGREPTSAEIHVIARATRDMKLAEITTPEVRASQWQMLDDMERKRLSAIKVSALTATRRQQTPRRRLMPEQIKSLAGKAIDHLYERSSVLKGHALMAEALNISLGQAVPDDFNDVFRSNDLVKLSSDDDVKMAYFGSLSGLSFERESVTMINTNIDKYPDLGKTPQKLDHLAPDQSAAVTGILSCRDFACALRGLAGSGKTTALQSVDKGLIAAGRKPIYLAPTRSAVKVLTADGFANATTIAAFMMKPPPMNNKTVLVVDESSLMSNRIGSKVLFMAKKAGARIVFVGDTRQHVSVEAGDFLRVIETYSNLKTFELSQIKRQIPEEYREAIKEMADGLVADGLERLKNLGAVKERKSHYLESAATRYVANVCEDKPTLLVSPTHQEIDVLTDLIRAGLTERGKLSADGVTHCAFVDFQWTRQQIGSAAGFLPGMAIRFNMAHGPYQKHDVLTITHVRSDTVELSDGTVVHPALLKNFISVGKILDLKISPGDKLLITANDKTLKLTNGQIVEVAKINADGGLVLQGGGIIPASFKSLSYGYATTSHKSQGMTSDNVILAAASLDQRSCYVGSSRGRQTVTLYCPDFEYLQSKVKNASDRLAASDLIAADLVAAREKYIHDYVNKL